jgi:hypothetical protein
LRAGTQVEILLSEVELTRGHDGLLRGSAEPSFVFGVYSIRPGEAQLVGREIVRLGTVSTYPIRLSLGRELVRRRLFRSSSDEARPTLAILAVAIEEDSGADVRTVFGELEHPELLSFWNPRVTMPEPRSLDEIAMSSTIDEPAAIPIGILREGRGLEQIEHDDWIGAAIAFVRVEPMFRQVELRFAFAARDAKNDWTAVLRVRVG